MDYYKILKVPLFASKDEIKSAFRKVIKEHHPDLTLDTRNDYTKEVIKAYKVLSNAKLRQEYDGTFNKTKCTIVKYNDYLKIPKSRFIYQTPLNILSRRKQKLNKPKIDIVINLSKNEITKNIVLTIPLPTKEKCDFCYDTDNICNICNGKRYVLTYKNIEVFIKNNTLQNQILSIDLRDKQYHNEKSSFTIDKLRILIKIK